IDHDGLAVALHLQLLQVSGKAAQRVIVGEPRQGRELQQVDVPRVDASEQRGKVLSPCGAAEMLIYLVAAAEKVIEVALADRDGERNPDRGPDGIAAPDPVPHLEAVLRMHPEL